ncbi:STAS domain-containing protein [Aliagarivorans marinus]|uniref:STAS domain-containing protein n=1 Tax=Aliagarivorans marinus TaxID=561965 RepID=UPI00040DE4B2|nr:STAS domain-containing protein [Aliagarivorans marinus]
MQIQAKQTANGVMTVYVSGEFCQSETLPMSTRLNQLCLAARSHTLVVDLSATTSLDSFAIASLVRSFKQLAAKGAKLLLRGAIGQPRKLLTMLRIHHVIPMFDDVSFDQPSLQTAA